MIKVETRKNGTIRVATFNEEPSKTDPSFKEMSDVNNIMDRYRKTGQITYLRNSRGQFADVSNQPDLLQASQLVEKASKAFNALPSELRYKFNNSPIDFFNFLHDPANHEEAIKLGIIEDTREKTQAPPSPTPTTTQKTKTKKSVVNDDELNDDDQTD